MIKQVNIKGERPGSVGVSEGVPNPEHPGELIVILNPDPEQSLGTPVGHPEQ